MKTYTQWRLRRLPILIAIGFFLLALGSAAVWTWLGAPPIIVGIWFVAMLTTAVVTWIMNGGGHERVQRIFDKQTNCNYN